MNIDIWPTAEIDKFHSLVDLHWRRGHILARDSDLTRWQYRNLRDPSRLSILRATDGETILGLIGLIQVDFNVFGARLPAAWLALWFVIPHAPSGTGLALLREALRISPQITACLGFNDAAEKIYRGLRFRVIDVPRWIRIIRPRAVEQLLRRDGDLANGMAEMLELSQPGPESSRSNAPVQFSAWSDAVAGSWDEAWAAQFAATYIGTCRDSAYLRWRYIEHPRFKYEFIFANAHDDTAACGVIVYRIEPLAGQAECVVRIVEFFADPSVSVELANEVVVRASSANALFIDFHCTLPSVELPLKAAGFLDADAFPTPIPMLFQPIDFRRTRMRAAIWNANGVLNGTNSASHSGLYITRSDGDQDRPN